MCDLNRFCSYSGSPSLVPDFIPSFVLQYIGAMLTLMEANDIVVKVRVPGLFLDLNWHEQSAKTAALCAGVGCQRSRVPHEQIDRRGRQRHPVASVRHQEYHCCHLSAAKWNRGTVPVQHFADARRQHHLGRTLSRGRHGTVHLDRSRVCMFRSRKSCMWVKEANVRVDIRSGSRSSSTS